MIILKIFNYYKFCKLYIFYRTKDGETMDTKNLKKRMKILDEFPNFYLIINDIEIDDAGRYCCLATNFLGYDSTEAVLTVNGNKNIFQLLIHYHILLHVTFMCFIEF